MKLKRVKTSSTKNRRISGYLIKEKKVEEKKENQNRGQKTVKKFKGKEKNVTQVLRRSARNVPPESGEKVDKPINGKEPIVEDLPKIVFEGKINFVNDFNDCAAICDELVQEVEKSPNETIPIGFDLEWPVTFKPKEVPKTALAQICMSEKVCHLLHIHELKKLPASFIVLLSHQKVKLVGVNIKNDVRKIAKDFPEIPADKIVQKNCIDSGVYTNRVFNRSCRWGMASLTEFLLKKQISKDSKVRCSKWHILPLSDSQKLYAATDAYVSLLLHQHIQNEVEKAEKSNTTVLPEEVPKN